MWSETKWERKQEGTGGTVIDGSSTKGTVRSSSEQRVQNECGWNTRGSHYRERGMEEKS